MHCAEWRLNQLVLLGVILFTAGKSAGEPEFSGSLIYDSKYVSEGRDNLEDGGLPSAEVTVELDALSFGLWYARGDRTTYDELNLCAEYGLSLGAFEGYVCYTRLEFMEDEASDDELSLGISRKVGDFNVALDWVYSCEAEGAFLEFSICREFEVSPNLMVGVQALEGFDLGYASEAYDGPNNFQVSLYLDYALNEKTSLNAGLSHSWAHGDVHRDGLGDVSWASASLRTLF